MDTVWDGVSWFFTLGWWLHSEKVKTNRCIYFLAMKTSIKIILPSRDAPFQLVLLCFLLDSAQDLLETSDVDTGLTKMLSVQSPLAFLSSSNFWLILIIILPKPCRQILLTCCHLSFPMLFHVWDSSLATSNYKSIHWINSLQVSLWTWKLHAFPKPNLY